MTLLDLPPLAIPLDRVPRAPAPTYLAVPVNLGCLARGVEQGPVAVWRQVQVRAAQRPFDPQLDAARRLRLVSIPGSGCLDENAAACPVDEHPAYLAALAETCERVAASAADVARSGAPLVAVGGDHTMAIGTVAGLRRVYDRVGVLWIDAHADLNTWAESATKHAHGMVTAAILGRPGTPRELLDIAPAGPKVAQKHLVMLGLRDLDWGEKAYLREHPELRTSSIDDVECEGIAALTERIIRYFQEQRLDAVHVSFDIDAIDPAVAPGTGVPVSGGLSEREALYLVGELARSRSRIPVRSLDIAEVNPALDRDNRTAALAARMTCRFLGEEVR
jgi:arginase